ncbi:MAG TPA: hypothetical protein VHX37_05545 [Acidobacteriaceae bacterium]|jgi:hypothetical protein|nr:hypothetical protein [Acidobacteriaceae bacterium]
MATGQILASEEFTPELRRDPRWRVIERILQTPPFQKSAHLTPLLQYLAEQSILGRHDALTERQIGTAVFGKPLGYSPAEDSAVRVHVRQLRLRLHEYYACEGHNEQLIIDIPKGSYVLEFRSAPTEARPFQEIGRVADLLPAVRGAPEKRRRMGAPFWALAVLAAIAAVCGFGWYHAARALSEPPLPWPLSAVIHSSQQTTIVTSDSKSMLRLLGTREISLAEYLQPGYLESMIPAHMDPGISRLLDYVAESQLTSYADLNDATAIIRLAGSNGNRLSITSAHDLHERDLENGNYVFMGGPTSNPWVSLFENKLNFQVVEDGIGGTMHFLNRTPRPGEQATYEGLPHTGSAGDDYATISLLPTSSGNGNVLILQGLRQEGTEGLGELLSDATDRAGLRRALGYGAGSPKSPYFEALIRVHAVAGAPLSISIVATREIQP